MLKKYKLLQPLWRTVQKFLKKLKINITWHTVIPLLGIYLKGIKSAYKGDTSVFMFNVGKFTIGEIWNQLRCLLMKE
jgi:hypothetical protein